MEREEQEKPVRRATAPACSLDITCPRGSSLCRIPDLYCATCRGELELSSPCLRPKAIGRA